MKYEFNITLNINDLFNCNMNYAKTSKTFFFDIFFTIAAFVITGFTIVTGRLATMSLFKKCLLVVCCIMFPIIHPAIVYLKSIPKAKLIKDKVINVSFDDEQVYVKVNGEVSSIKYGMVYNFIKYKNMIVIMYDSVKGQIIPDRYLVGIKDEFYNFVKDKIVIARENMKANETK